MNYASNAYRKTAIETAGPRELEANLLLQAAAKLQQVRNSWRDKPTGLNDAVTFNRRLWTIFINSVMKDDNKLPVEVRSNIPESGHVRHGRDLLADDQAEPQPPRSNHQRESQYRGRIAREGVNTAAGRL